MTAFLLDLLFLLLQIFAVSGNAAFLVFLPFLFRIALRQKREHQTGQCHAVTAHHDRTSAHHRRGAHPKHQWHFVRTHRHRRRIHGNAGPFHGIAAARAAVEQLLFFLAASTSAGRQLHHGQCGRLDIQLRIAGAYRQKVCAHDDAGTHQIDHIA